MKSGLPAWLWQTLALLEIAASLALIAGDALHPANPTNFGFQADAAGKVGAVTRGSAAAHAGIVRGDRISLVDNTLADRLSYNADAVAVGTRLTLGIEHLGRSRTTVLIARPSAAGIPTAESIAVLAAFEVIRFVFILVASIIVLRRPERADARALATFFIAFAAAVLQTSPWYPTPITALLFVLRTVVLTFALAQAARFAALFPSRSERGLRRLIEHTITWIAAVGMVAAGGTNLASLVNVRAPGDAVNAVASVISLAAIIIILIALAVGFVLARGKRRPRIVRVCVGSRSRSRSGSAVSFRSPSFSY